MEKAKNADEYIAKQRAAIASNPECGTSHYNLGVALLGKKFYDEAEKELLEAVEHSPTLAEAYVQLGGICLKRGDTEGCLSYNQRSVHSRAGFAIGHGNIGFIKLQMGQIDDAIVSLEKAIKYNNKFLQAYTTLANAYLMRDMIDESIETNMKALELEPDFPVVHNNLAVAYLEKGEKELAAEHVKKAEKLGYEVAPEILQEIDELS